MFKLAFPNLFYVILLALLMLGPAYQQVPLASGLIEPKYEFILKWGRQGFGERQFYSPHGVAVDSSGNVYVAEWSNHRIQKFTSDGKFITMWGSNGSGEGQFNYPHGIAVDSSGNVYVTEVYTHRIQKFTSDGKFIAVWGSNGSGEGQFNNPRGVAVDLSGNVYVADTKNQRIQKFTSDGKFITMWGSKGSAEGQFNNTFGLAVDSSSNVYVADVNNHRIQKFTSDGAFITMWGSYGSGDGQFDEHCGLAVDSSGNVYVVDVNIHRIQKFAKPSLTITLPNGGETWARDTTHTLTWTQIGSPSVNVKIELLTNGSLNSIISSSAENNGFYKWKIPVGQALGTDYMIRITSTSYPTVVDSSNFSFAITPRDYAVNIDEITVSNPRCDVGSTQHIKLHATWDNGTDVSGGTIFLGDQGYLTNSDGWTDYDIKSNNVEEQVFSVTAVDCSGVTKYTQSSPTPSIIWDKVNVTLSINDDRVNILSNPVLDWKATYEYDNSSFQGKVNFKIINSQTPPPSPVSKGSYIVESIEDNKYGLTLFESNQVDVIWDRIKITQSGVSSQLTKTGNNETVWFKAIYEYDGKEFTGELTADGSANKLFVNNVPLVWSNLEKVWKYSTKLDDNGKLTFEVTGVKDVQYKLTKFIDTTGPQYIIWEKPFLETTVGIILAVTVLATIIVSVMFFIRKRR